MGAPMIHKSIYYQQPYHQILAVEIKVLLVNALNTLFWSDASAIRRIKAVRDLFKVLKLVNTLPEPTAANTRQPNTHILIGIRDRFFSRLVLQSRQHILRGIVNFAIIIYDTDFYRQFFDVWVDELRASDWKPRGPLQPDHHYWNKEITQEGN